MTYRILYVQHSASMGGAPLSLLYLIEKLDRTRYKPEVLFLTDGGPAVDLFRARGIPTHTRSDISYFLHAWGGLLTFRAIPPWRPLIQVVRFWPSVRRFRRFLVQHPADVVHLNSSCLVPCAIGAHKVGVPIVWHVREHLHPGHFGLRRWLIRSALHTYPERVIAISTTNAELLQPGPKIQVIYNFVDFREFDRRKSGVQVRRAFGLSPDAPVVGMLGGIIKHKGALILVQAAAKVRMERPEVRFLIAGYPPQGESPSRLRRTGRRALEGMLGIDNYEQTLVSAIRQHHLEDVVRFAGVRRDVPEFIAALDVLVFPSTVPHFARPIIEAGAMARPVIGSNLDGVRELIVDGETGLLVPVNDPEALADAILKILNDPERGRAMGEAGYYQARAKFDAERNVLDILAVYDEVVSQHGSCYVDRSCEPSPRFGGRGK